MIATSTSSQSPHYSNLETGGNATLLMCSNEVNKHCYTDCAGAKAQNTWLNEPDNLSTNGRQSRLIKLVAPELKNWSKSFGGIDADDCPEVKDPMSLMHLMGLNLLLKLINCKLHTKSPVGTRNFSRWKSKPNYPLLKTFSHSNSLNTSLNSLTESLDDETENEIVSNPLSTLLSPNRHKRRHYSSESDLVFIQSDLQIMDKSELSDILNNNTYNKNNNSINNNNNRIINEYPQFTNNINNRKNVNFNILGATVSELYKSAHTKLELVQSTSEVNSNISQTHSSNTNNESEQTYSEQNVTQQQKSECDDDKYSLSDSFENKGESILADKKTKRSVSFADEIGRPLSECFLFYSDEDCNNLPEYEDDFDAPFIKAHPIRYRSSLKCRSEQSLTNLLIDNQQTTNESVKPEQYVTQYIWSQTFPQPASQYFDFRQKMELNSVSLENVTITQLDDTNKTYCRLFNISGTIKVKNMYFNKQVWLRLTKDNWQNSTDYTADYSVQFSINNVVGSSRFDTFVFNINVEFAIDEFNTDKFIEFAIRYITGPNAEEQSEYWDNNVGKNYRIEQKQSRSLLNGAKRSDFGEYKHTNNASTYSLDYQPNPDKITSFTEYKVWRHYENETNYY